MVLNVNQDAMSQLQLMQVSSGCYLSSIKVEMDVIDRMGAYSVNFITSQLARVLLGCKTSKKTH